ncbi:DUF1289 domain-containing protein [Salinibius halmophilus]|uniref:DUF1289 domain-containing protein n=1 Tax=Salinibius halmophilus TaxID=1853216 RepID=UPI000E66FDF9|nr:DUF1289 domain-containing protein [Salinibius halmophilus]
MVMKARKLSDSPCIGKCSTSVGDDICTGCLRSLSDIANWLMWSEDERAMSNIARHQQIVTAMQAIHVTNKERLAARMNELRLRRTEGADPRVWLFEALSSSRADVSQFADLVSQPEQLASQWQTAKRTLIENAMAFA